MGSLVIKLPKVSIIIASYNHEKYVRECIQSALDQTYQDFEIVITDDGSSDRTVEVIKEFADPRIRLDAFIYNKGVCTALNNCISKAVGDYIAVLNSDDTWELTKLEKQVAYLDAHPEVGAVFTKAAFIDEAGNLMGPEKYQHFYAFEKKNRSRYEWLKHFFVIGNCLCHPSILIRKKCHEDIGLYNKRMFNLHDLDTWVRLCFKYEIHILDDKLVRFRIRDGELNAGSDRMPNRIRIRFEHMQILNHYLAIADKQLLLNIFPEAKKYGLVENKYIPYFLSMLALSVEHNSWHPWGLEVLYNLLGVEENATAIKEKYGFRYLDLHNLTAKHDIFNLSLVYPAPAAARKFIHLDKQNKLLKFAISLDRWLIKIALKFLK